VCPAFVRVYSREEIAMVRYSRKRPVDNSSMASAATVAAVVNGFADRYVEVHCDGGSLFVQWLDRDNAVYVAGTAEYAFSGSYYFEERRSAL
jgi:diaminopimelate epimerase